MITKIFRKAISVDFTGINAECSALEAEGGEVNRAVNLEFAAGNSLRGRVGSQIAGQVGNLFGIFPHSYTRTQDEYALKYQVASGTYPNQTAPLTTTRTGADGASITKLVGINRQVWTLDQMIIPITRVSGTYPFTWYATVSGSVINFIIKANGVSILTTSLGDGLSSSTNIYSLLNTIDGTAELAVSRTTRGTCPPFAVVNGNQSTAAGASTVYGTRYTVTVNAGHNFSAGDIITFPTTVLAAGFVISTTATTIVYVGYQVTLNDGDILGYMGQSAAGFPISQIQTAGSGNLNISFPYWRLVPEGDAPFGLCLNDSYGRWFNRSATNPYTPPNATSAQGDLFIATSSNTNSGNGWANNLLKSDGLSISRVGLPKASMTAVALAGGALAGVYKYKAFLRRVDAQGNIIEGRPSDVQTVTLGGGNNQTTLTEVATSIGYTSATGFQTRSCYKNTGESPATNVFFYVDDNATPLTAFLQPGDPVCLLDNTAPKVGLSIGTLHRTVCTDYCPLLTTISPTSSSIRVADSSGYNIPDNTPISAGLTMVFLRTAAGNNKYYVLCEIPVTGYANFAFTDNVTDAVLTAGVQYQEITLGKEHDPAPTCTMVCQHQGNLAVAGGLTTPNTVSFSTADGIEYFPLASNNFDIPSTQSGAITAIASDTVDRLAVFKERAYYDVVGDLDSGSFSVNVKHEGDYGIPSHASLIRICSTGNISTFNSTYIGKSSALIGLSKNGFILISEGDIDTQKFRQLNARMQGQNWNFNYAVGINDPFNRCYICSIPTSTTPQTFVVDYSRESVHTFERTYASQVDSAGGFVMIGNTLYSLSQASPYGVFRRLDRFNGDSPTGNNADSFIDNTQAINYILESQPINFGEPALLKSPIRLRLWSIPNDFVIDGWVPFSTLLETGASPLSAYIGGGAPLSTTSTLTFTSTDFFKDVKLVSCKSHFYMVRFTTNAVRQSPFITGYEIAFTENYDKEDFVK